MNRSKITVFLFIVQLWQTTRIFVNEKNHKNGEISKGFQRVLTKILKSEHFFIKTKQFTIHNRLVNLSALFHSANGMKVSNKSIYTP